MTINSDRFSNIEIKAKYDDLDNARNKLNHLSAKYLGKDFQKDTYLDVTGFRLKIREGNIENFLISYIRPNTFIQKESKVKLKILTADLKMKILDAYNIKVVVEKEREIYFLKNVKIHLDKIKDLGNFIEIEARNQGNHYSLIQLEEQCNYYKNLFEIKNSSLIAESYSDLISKLIEAENELVY